VRGCAVSAAAIAVVAGLATTGCLGGGGGNGEGVQRGAAIESALASVQQYPGARLVDRHDRDATSEFRYELPVTVPGSQVQLHFRRLLGTRRWQCSFRDRATDERYGFFCRREGASLDGKIADRGGYTLVVQVNGT
jgi:hypothetical protein